MSTTFEADKLWGWRYHDPDRLIDARGRDVTEQPIPANTSITRIMRKVGGWTLRSALVGYATLMPYARCSGTGAVLANATVSSP